MDGELVMGLGVSTEGLGAGEEIGGLTVGTAVWGAVCADETGVA